MKFTVAIDGPAAAGKGTISKAVAAHFDFAHLDTGLLYRAVGGKVLQGADPIDAAKTLDPSDLEDDTLRTPDVAQAASRVAAIPEVRTALVAFQQHFAMRDGGAVLDGRDIKELTEKGMEISLEQVLEDVEARDKRDRERATAPLIAADDATIIDTSNLTIKQAVAAAIAAVLQVIT